MNLTGPYVQKPNEENRTGRKGLINFSMRPSTSIQISEKDTFKTTGKMGRPKIYTDHRQEGGHDTYPEKGS